MIVLDGILIAGLFVLALAALFTADTFRAVLMFITFGLLVAITWVRLGAPDVALAEAAIGAGITGALLLRATRAGPDAAPDGDDPDA